MAKTLIEHAPLDTGPGRSAVLGYEFLGELGRGGMGVVYKARHIKLNRLVALKMILAGSYAREEDLAHFRTEAEAIAGLHHPHIVQIYDVGEHDGLPYISLEFVEGGTLEGRLDGTPWPAPRAARLLETLARAIHAAHQRGVIHRDLKPANVLLASPGPASPGPASPGRESGESLTPKITDFGLAKRLDQDAGQTRTGTIMGTPSYMAPEQAGGQKHAVGPAADTYALGAILYELLTGRPPFKAATPLDTVLQVIHGEPVPPAQLNSKVPRDLETICLKCLQKDPARRYESAEALGEDVRRFLAGEPILARPVGRVEKLGRWCRRNPLVAGLTSTVALVLVAGIVISSWFGVESSKSAREARRRLYVADLRLVQQSWEQDQSARVRELLDGQRPEQTDGTDLRGFEWYYWDRLAQAGLPTLEAHRWGITCVGYSPDGTQLACAGLDQTVNIWDVAGGRVVRSLPEHGEAGHADTITSIAFSRDGKRLASASADKTVKVWDLASGTLSATLTGSSGAVRAVAYSPDGKYLASAGDDREEGVKIWNVAGGPAVWTLPHGDAVLSLAFSRDGKQLASGGKDNVIRIWDMTRSPPEATRPLRGGHTLAVSGVAFSPDGQHLASSSWDGKVRLWDVAGGQVILSRMEHATTVSGVAFSPDGSRIASVGRDNRVKIWDATTGQLLLKPLRHTAAIRGVAFSPDGRHLASAGDDPAVRIWDVADGRELQVLDRTVEPLAFRLDGNPLGPGAQDRLVRVWDRVGRQATLTFTGHGKLAATSVCFSPDGKHLASTDWQQGPLLWDLDGNSQRFPLPAGLDRLEFARASRSVRTVSGWRWPRRTGWSSPRFSPRFSPRAYSWAMRVRFAVSPGAGPTAGRSPPRVRTGRCASGTRTPARNWANRWPDTRER